MTSVTMPRPVIRGTFQDMSESSEQAREDAALFFWVRQFLLTGQARAWRVDNGLSLRILARAAGVDESDLSRWERGLGRPSVAAGVRFARVIRDIEKGAR